MATEITCQTTNQYAHTQMLAQNMRPFQAHSHKMYSISNPLCILVYMLSHWMPVTESYQIWPVDNIKKLNSSTNCCFSWPSEYSVTIHRQPTHQPVLQLTNNHEIGYKTTKNWLLWLVYQVTLRETIYIYIANWLVSKQFPMQKGLCWHSQV